MGKRTLENWISLSCVIAFLFYFLHVIIGQNNYPDYNWMKQAVSDLTAIDSPSYGIALRYSSLYGAFACIGCFSLCILIREKFNRQLRVGIYLYSVMNMLSYVGYTLFPLSGKGYQGQFQDIMHLYVVTIGVILLSIISLIFIGISGFKKNGNRIIGILGFCSLLMMFIGSIGMNFVSKEYFGILERFSVFGAVIYTCILGIFGFNIKMNRSN